MSEYEIACRTLADLTTEYLEGAMSSRVRTTFEQHAVLCDACSVHLDQLRATRRILGGLGTADRATARALVSDALAGRG